MAKKIGIDVDLRDEKAKKKLKELQKKLLSQPKGQKVQ